MVMISTINSEDSQDVVNMPETPETLLYKNIAQRRHKSDVPKLESESQSISIKEYEERRSQPSQKSGQIEQSTGRLSQPEDVGKLHKSQRSQIEEHSSERKTHEQGQKDLDQGDNHTDSEYFREELIHELSQIQGKDDQKTQENQEEEEEEEKIDQIEDKEKVSIQESLNEEQSNKTNKVEGK